MMKIENNKSLALGLSFLIILIAGAVLFVVYTGGTFEMSFSNSVMFGSNTRTGFGQFGMVVFIAVVFILVRIRSKYLGY